MNNFPPDESYTYFTTQGGNICMMIQTADC